jgi:hypothetical protein
MYKLWKKDKRPDEDCLGFPPDFPRLPAAMEIANWYLSYDENGFVYFYDLLFQALKRQKGQFDFKEKTLRNKLVRNVID